MSIQTETLELLEWSRLCEHLSTFAATKLGTRASRSLPIPAQRSESEGLLAQTAEVVLLENRVVGGLDFTGIQDIGDALERASLHGLLTGEELLAIATTLAGARQLRRTINPHDDCPTLQGLVGELRTYPELEQEIHHCIDDQGRVTDRASPVLGELRQQLRQVRDRLQQVLQNILQRQATAVQEQLILQRGDRFVLPVKATHREAIPGIVHDTSMSGATLYIEPHSTVNLNNQLRQLNRREQAEEEVIRRQLTRQITAVCPDLEHLLYVCTCLDLATARARYSLWLEANQPRFTEPAVETGSARMTLRQLRHPLLVWQQQYEQGQTVVPIDVVIPPSVRVVAITGPNTGGKTASLKTLGLVALMAKVGLFVPAREPVELPWFDLVLADIGDEQSLQQSLSTFSGHIRRIAEILAYLTPASLVLLDEVGAGTDPSEGSALAIALLKALAEQACLTIATTHFGELKALKYQDSRFENASVEFDEATLSPTYRLLWGIPGRSNALTIARRLGLSSAIVDQAKTLVGSSSQEVNQVILGLESQRREQESRANAAGQLLQETERLHRQLQERMTALQERERNLHREQEVAVQQAIARARREIARVIRQLQQGQPTAQDAAQATQELDRLAREFLPTPAAPVTKPQFMPQVGDRLRIPRLGQTVEVITPPNAEGELMVRFGLMKMTVSLADVESLDGQKPELPPRPPSKPARSETPAAASPAPAVRTSRNTFDLRGSRVADAEVVLDKAIAEADGPLWVIHGHGTGRLRHGIHAWLQQHPQVSHFTPAEPADGGSGVTVVYPLISPGVARSK